MDTAPVVLAGEDDEYRFFKRLVNSDLDELVAAGGGAGAAAVMFVSATPTLPSSSLSESDPIMRISSMLPAILTILC